MESVKCKVCNLRTSTKRSEFRKSPQFSKLVWHGRVVFVRGKKHGIEFSRLVYKKVLGFLNIISDKVQKLP